MSATVIDGKAIAQQVGAEVRDGVDAWIAAGNEDPRVSGILLQLPTPAHIDGSVPTTRAPRRSRERSRRCPAESAR